MKETKELTNKINQADIPQLLKDYLFRNKQIQLTLNTNLLDDIQDLYIEYDSLYIFDEAEFSSYVITGLKKQDKHDYFYNYLKIVMQSNMYLSSKYKKGNELLLNRMYENIHPKVNNISEFIFNLYSLIDTYKESKDTRVLFSAFRISGLLEVLFDIFPAHEYADEFKKVNTLLQKISVE